MAIITAESLGALGLSGYGVSAETQTKVQSGSDDSLGQDAFLTLMIAQLQNQDPTNPLQNEDFVAQLAQFSTVAGIEELSSAFTQLSQTLSQNQTLQAASIVGNTVLVPASSIELDEGQGLSGAVNLPSSSSNVTLTVYGPSGEVARTLDLGSLSAGLQDFAWDGLLDDGTPAPAGAYKVEVTADIDGASQSLQTWLDGKVQSVTMDYYGGGVLLDVLGIGNVSFSDVYRIG